MSKEKKGFGTRFLAVSAVLVMVMAGLLILNLDSHESDAATEVTTPTEFISALATGHVKLNRDITFPLDRYSISLNCDATIDLNGHVLKSEGSNFAIITEGYNLTITSSNKGWGKMLTTVGVTANSVPNVNKWAENIIVNDGVFVRNISFYEMTSESNLDKYASEESRWGVRETGWINRNVESHVQKFFKLNSLTINDGVVGIDFGNFDVARNYWYTKNVFGQFTDYHCVQIEDMMNSFRDHIVTANVSAGQSLYYDDVKYDDLGDISLKMGGKLAVYSKTIDTSAHGLLDSEITVQPTDSAPGTAVITNYYSDETHEKNMNGVVTQTIWYRSVDGGGYVKCDGYSGNYALTTGSIEDRNIQRGAHLYTYYAEITVMNNMVSKTFTTEKERVYSAPLTPTSAGIAGQENASLGSSVTFTGAFNTASGNVGGNLVGNQYKWQKSTDGGETWSDIGGIAGTKLTYQPSTSVAGTTLYKFLVRAEGKGGLFSDWKESAPLSFTVGDYNSPVIGLNCADDITEVKGYNVNVGITVDNAGYYDSLSYQWYYEQSPGTFVRLSGNPWGGYTFSGVDTATLTVSNSNATADDLNVHCQVTGIKNGYKRIANSEDVSVSFINLPEPEITGHPQNANVSRGDGSLALAVYAKVMQGTMTYQWQLSDNGTDWSNISGATNFNYLVSKAVPTSGTYYRCLVTNDAGTTYSDAAKVIITDKTILDATLVKGLEVTVSSAADGYVIDNENRMLICHIGDIFTIDFTESEGNATTTEKRIGTDWRERTGIETGGVHYINADLSGAFVYYGYFYAEYDNTVDDVQSVVFDRTNSEEMTYTVIVLPNADTNEIAPIVMELGDVEPITLGADYSQIFTSGVSTTAPTFFRGNHSASSYYHFVSGYRLFLGIPNGDDINYVCVATAECYNDSAGTYDSGVTLSIDTTAATLAALGIDTLSGVYDAYVVMNYQQIVDEDVDGVFIVKHDSYETHHFTITVNEPCQHEHVTTTYTFDYSNPEEPTIYIDNVCDECGVNNPDPFIRIYEEGTNGLPIIAYAATCDEDGMLEHKHFSRGQYDIYYVKDSSNHWVVCDNPDDLVIKATHQYQAVPGVAATCTTDGSVDHFKCTVCNELFIDEGDGKYGVTEEAIRIDAFHKHLTLVPGQAATCTADGWKDCYTCTECHKYFSDAAGQNEITDLAAWKTGAGKIDKTGEHTWGAWTTVQAATASEDGIDERVCIFNPEHKERKYVTPSGQHYDKDESGNKVFSEDVIPGNDAVLTDLFAAAKGAGGKIDLAIGQLSISFDANAVSSLGTGAVTINAKLVTQNPSVEGAEAVIDVTLAGASFGDGKATVSFPFNKTVPEGKVPVVYFMDGANKTKVDFTFENGKITFEVSHFSTYAVFFEDAPSPSNGGGFPIWIVIVIVVVVLAAGGAGAFFFMKNKKA